jgi:hypothetical protein
MKDQNYEAKLYDLRQRVGMDSKTSTDNTNISFTPIIKKIINYKSPYFYAIPPVIILILLIVFKPSFICTDTIDSDNVVTQKMDFKKTCIPILIGGAIINIVLFAYLWKKK